ncbi:hypothetical protein POVWA2_020320 [Plasmodium ovale wallikeri]|uniref:Uncharacterized protein n=1 Tax=Plasmodium ovale wallikeri TaxID=864142 RepID=A0A1A8YSC5_PLAOA|nr:hypothetical protein POVWA1_020130 [Plasmodium ovale wallikeri]SBT34543.1 hypothetical protein POVWA2_020320 [Plasmodium ovale wallikeri]
MDEEKFAYRKTLCNFPVRPGENSFVYADEVFYRIRIFAYHMFGFAYLKILHLCAKRLDDLGHCNNISFFFFLISVFPSSHRLPDETA